MAVYELKNELLCVTIDSHGAELKSLKRNHDNQEYMWKGDPAFWGRTSPVLFPFVGGVNQKKYRVDGKEYAMNQHGFARRKSGLSFIATKKPCRNIRMHLC